MIEFDAYSQFVFCLVNRVVLSSFVGSFLKKDTTYRSYANEMAATPARTLKTIVFLGTVREGRMGLRVAKFIVKQLEEQNHTVDLFGKSLLCDCIYDYTSRVPISLYLSVLGIAARAANLYHYGTVPVWYR